MNAEQLRASIRELAAAAQQSAGQHCGQDDGGLWDMAASLMQVADAPQAPQADRSGCTAGTDEECKHRQCATQCPKRAQIGQGVADGLLESQIEPRPLLYPLSDYHRAMTDGPLHYTWIDKPHRLVYDLIAAVRYYASAPPAPQAAVVQQEPVAMLTMFDMRSQTGTVDLVGDWKELRVGDPLYTHPAPKAKQSLTDQQITAGAKALCKRSSEICGVNADDNWNLESEYFKDDARCVLEAAHNIRNKE